MNTFDRIRAFIAIPTSPQIRERIAEIQSELKLASPSVKWEDPSKFHLTLKFLGNTQIQVIHTLTDQIKAHLGSLPPFDLQYRTLGCFPSLARPSVIWIGTVPHSSVERIHTVVEETCRRFGFAKEDRQFHAHVTLGRVKGNRSVDRLTERVKTLTFEPFLDRCTAVHLMRSELHPTGSTYFLVKSIPLHP